MLGGNLGSLLYGDVSMMGHDQHRVIIYINFEELEPPMIHAKFQDHRTSGSGEEDF